MLTATLEKLLNRGLPRSPRARELCAQLAGRSLGDRAARPGTRCASPPTAQHPRARLQRRAGGCDSFVARPSAARRCRCRTRPRRRLQRGAVALGGDAELAQRFRELLQRLRPDPKRSCRASSAMSPRTSLGRSCPRRRWTWTRRALQTAHREPGRVPARTSARDLVPRAEGEQFLRGVDALREDLDRLQARLDLLARRRRPAVKLRVLLRLLEIQRVLLRHGLDDYVRATHLYRPLRFAVLPVPRNLVRAAARAQPRRAAAPGAGGARADLREVRPGGVHAPRPAATRHRR